MWTSVVALLLIGGFALIYTNYTAKTRLLKSTTGTLIERKKQDLKIEVDNFINFLQTEYKFNRKNAENMMATNSNNIFFMFTIHHMKKDDIINAIKVQNRSNTILTALFKNGIDILNPSLNLDSCFIIRNKQQINYGSYYNCNLKSNKITLFIANTPPGKSDKLIIASYIKNSDIQKSLKYIALQNINDFFINKDKNSYIFILKLLNINGGKKFAKVITIKNKPELTGKYISDETRDIKGSYWHKEFLKGLREHGEIYLTYFFRPVTTTKPLKKLSFFKLYKPVNWIIGTGFYPEDYIKGEGLTANKIYDIFLPILVIFILGIIIFIIVSVLWTKLLHNIKKDMLLINGSIANIGTSDIVINRDAIHYIRADNIASSINALSAAIKHGKWLLQKNENDFLMSIATLVEERDPYTRYHSENVAFYAREIAKIVRLDTKSCSDLYKAGLLHDIGKIGIPDTVLLKPGKLTSNEYNIIKQHALFSYFAVKDIERFKSIALPIKQHHEKCDGTGYPDGLTGDKITIGGRILAIADIFDAVTQERVYRKYAMSVKQAAKILQKSHLDNDILNMVIPHLDDMFRGGIEAKTFVSEIINIERQSAFRKDYLTGLLKRREFIEKIKLLLDKKVQFFIFHIDILHLSDLNYKFSQDAGDHLLERISIVLKNSSEIYYPARTGGDSFQFIYKMQDPEAFSIILRNRLIKCDERMKPEYYISYVESLKGKNERELMHAADVAMRKIQVTHL